MDIDTKSTQNRHKMSEVDTKWAVLCRFWGGGIGRVSIKFIGMCRFLCRKCQGDVKNMSQILREWVSPPNWEPALEKKTDPNLMGGVPFPKILCGFFAFFVGARWYAVRPPSRSVSRRSLRPFLCSFHWYGVNNSPSHLLALTIRYNRTFGCADLLPVNSAR